MAKKKKFLYRWPIGLTDDQYRMVVMKGIRPEHVRSFIERYGELTRSVIKSSEWRRLKQIIDRVPSLQVVGDVGSGKTFMVSELVKNDKDHIYLVLDSHNEYDWLPVVNNLTPDCKESVRIKMPEQPEGAVGMFGVYYNLIMNNQFPKHFVLVVDEALRYKEKGIKNLLAESRKFLKVMAITQEKLAEFTPSIDVEPYVKYKV